MPDYLFTPQPQASLAIQGSSKRFAVHRIYCVGRNFSEHAKEMGAVVEKGNPVFFMKPADAVIQAAEVPYPSETRDLHHEVEMVLALGQTISEPMTLDNALQSIYAYAVGLDLTRRDLQALAKEKRLPWDTSKGFDASAPISVLVPASETTISPDTRLQLHVNGKLRQSAVLGDMIYSCAEVLVALSKLFALKTGDLIFMGTPAGVAALEPGDTYIAELEGVVSLSGHIV